MNDPVFCSVRHNTLRYTRWVILILPLFLVGCFDTQSRAKGRVQETGIAAISRFFAFNQEASSEKTKEANISAEPLAVPIDISESPDIAQKAVELGIAIPSFIESNRGLSKNAPKIGDNLIAASGKYARRRNSSSESPAAMSLNASFNQLFESVFGSTKKDETPNPFTEARQKQEALSASSETKGDATESKSKSEKQASTEGSSKSETTNSVVVESGAGISASERFLIIGDFDGSGILKASYADRLSDTRFASSDGERNFSLSINSAAVEQQSAFCVDDINADGNPDLLVTSRASLFGSLLLGDGNGGYRVGGVFLTGFEATIPIMGPYRNGLREILTANIYSGVLKTFHSSAHHQTEKLSFIPNYLLHLVAADTSLEFLMAGQAGGSEQILGWNNDGVLQPVAGGLGADPTVLSGDFSSYSWQAYQVGSYASIVLTSGGFSFNVVNMHVNPKIFLIIGDLQQQGSRDVAVANLMLFTPKSSH